MKRFYFPLLAIMLLCVTAASAQTFTFVQRDTLRHYTNVDTVYEFHGAVHNLLPETRSIQYSLTPVLFADTARNTSICTFVGCYPPHSGSYSVPQEYEPSFDDTLLKFTLYNIISDWSQGFPMPVESSLVGDYIFDIMVQSVENPDEQATARVSLIFGEGIAHEIVTPLPLNNDLVSNFPNPFNASTQLRFSLTSQGPVTLSVYDILGHQVSLLIDGQRMQPGTYTLNWASTSTAGSPLPSGNYLVRLNSLEQSTIHRVTLIR